MKILAIDTSAITATVALCEDGNLIAAYQQNGTLTHSETMLPMIENLLNNAHMTIDNIDLFAVSAGPGSFTGVRIGVSVIKGLSFGKGKPCVPVSTLEALAENLRPLSALGRPFYAVPVMDARRHQLYTALFHYDGENLVRMSRDDMISAEQLSDRLQNLTEQCIFVGDGCRVTEHDIILPNVSEAPEMLRWQNGIGVAAVAKRVYEMAEDKTVFTDVLLRPTYLRPSQAERERNGEKN